MKKKGNTGGTHPARNKRLDKEFLRIVQNARKMFRPENKSPQGHYTSADYPADELTEQ